MRREHYVVFGAWKEPNKVLIAAKPENGPGRRALVIGQLRDSSSYGYGDSVARDDVEGIYTTLFFCKKESLDAFIKTLVAMREDWDKEEAQHDICGEA